MFEVVLGWILIIRTKAAEEYNRATSNSQDLVGKSNVRRSNRVRKKPLKLLD